jgi:hypothetical protein
MGHQLQLRGLNRRTHQLSTISLQLDKDYNNDREGNELTDTNTLNGE